MCTRASVSSATEIEPRLSMSRTTSSMRSGVACRMKAPPLAPLLQPDDAGDLEAAQRLAQGVAADAELLGQLALGRQLVARA